MSARIAETLLSSRTDTLRLHRRVVRVGAAAAWFVAAVFIVSGLVTGDGALLIEAVGPVTAAAVMTAMILMEREDGAVALLGSALVIVVVYAVVGNPATLVPAAVALIAVSSTGMLFIVRRQVVVVAIVFVSLLGTPLIWGLSGAEAALLGSVMAVSYLITTVIFTAVRNAVTALDVKFRVLFERSPTALLEEDWTEALAYVRSEYTGRVDRVRQFLTAYPAVVNRAVSLTKVRRVNQSAVELLQALDPEQLLGYRSTLTVTEENQGFFVDVLVALYQGRDRFEGELLTKTLQGREIYLQVRAVDESGGESPESTLVALADITHVRAREEYLAELIKTKDAFIASISHELRTPLTAVLGLASEISAQHLAEEERSELMELVSGQAQEMNHIVEDLLVAARAEMGTVSIEPGIVDLNEEIRSALEGLDIRVDSIPAELPSAWADAGRVRQILRNLLTNMSRYGGPNRRIQGGSIVGRVWVEVRDDGEGVRARDVDRIFEPYGTAHTGVSDSVGLGLSVARQLAELMGGSLTYRRDRNESVFRLELPMAKRHAAV